MTYIVLPRLPYPAQLSWCLKDSMGRRWGASCYVDALMLANMLNMLTLDQCNAAAAEAVAQWKEPT